MNSNNNNNNKLYFYGIMLTEPKHRMCFSTLEIGTRRLRSVTEIAPESLA